MRPAHCTLTLALATMSLGGGALAASDLTREQAEEAGIDLPGSAAPTVATGGPRITPRKGVLSDLLLIPESTNRRVMAFDPLTGDLVDADFIPADAVNLQTPIEAFPNASGTAILVSDQLRDVVQEYALDGGFLGTFAPAGGVNTAILDNIRGIHVRANGRLLVTVGGGANDDTVAEFDASGNYLGNFVAAGSGGLASPFDVILGAEALVSGIDSDSVHRFDATTGAFVAILAGIDNFPEQVARAAGGNILVANFSGTQEGIVELTSAGALVGVYAPAALAGGYRGVYELPNGNLLVTNADGVHEIDRSSNLVETKISGVSSRFITFLPGPIPVELQSFSIE